MTERVAVIHDWLTGMRGGEAVLEGILDVLPQAELFTLFATQWLDETTRSYAPRSHSRTARG